MARYKPHASPRVQGALCTLLVTSQSGQLSDITVDPARGVMFYISSSNSSGGTSSRSALWAGGGWG